ncbi:hypothetical protein, partial [Flavobacterium sp. FlaQc-50]|uniref:hypothetical protein n=1 Tax=unclassified Flavobacterium TaxID=196869 RepID=UPI0037580BD3
QFSSFLNQSLNELACFAGCKGKQRFQISQAFLNLFFILFSQTFLKNKSSFLVSLSGNVCVVAGAKVGPLLVSTSFLLCFFCLFFNLFLNLLVMVFLQNFFFCCF